MENHFRVVFEVPSEHTTASYVKYCIMFDIKCVTAPVFFFGRYLRERQEAWQKEAEQRKRNVPDTACPPGHVMLPDSERLETLRMLKKSKELHQTDVTRDL